ncbi:MAG: archaemetzincin family Zn-dependent metalloprotease [Actinomycetota bacterium]|nr:archaemetzincin family Zn-dependent metalloprotease [Actinomycetota bacterium]
MSCNFQSSSRHIEVVPLGVVEVETLDFIAEVIAENFGVIAAIVSSIPLPEAALSARRGQYDASRLLKLIETHRHGDPLKSLGVTREDLFAKDLNFVFGQARLGGCCAVISLARLGAEHDGQDKRRIMLERVEKEAVHELGHTFGLKHCRNPHCVMYYSNEIRDTDRKSVRFCRECGVPQISLT